MFPQSRGRCCGACGTVARGIGCPGALSELRVAQGYTDTPVHLAPQDVGALTLLPRGFLPRGALTSLWVPDSLARQSGVSVQSGCQRQRKWKLSGAVSCRKSVSTLVGKCRPRYRELLRALFEHGVIKFRKKAHHHCAVFAVWRKSGDQRLAINARIPNTAFEAPDPVALATGQSFARVNMDTNDPIFVSGVDMRVAFYAMRPLEAFQDMFALDPVEAWEVDFARVVDQGIVDSWNEVVYPVLAVVPMGWK